MKKTLTILAACLSFNAMAQDEMTCTKFTERQERMMQDTLTATHPDKDVEFLKGEFCHNQNDSVFAQQAGGVAGAVIAPAGIAGPLLGLLFAIVAQASSPELAGTIKVVASIDGALIKRKVEAGTLDADSMTMIATSFSN